MKIHYTQVLSPVYTKQTILLSTSNIEQTRKSKQSMVEDFVQADKALMFN